MRLLLACFLIFLSVHLTAQNNYDCFYSPILSTTWDYLGPKNNPDELMHQRFGHISCFSVNPKDSNEIFVGSQTGALFHTYNRGASWTSLTDDNDLPIIGVQDLIVDYSKKPYHILIATGSSAHWYDAPRFGIFKSTDGGKTWLRKKANKKELFSDVYYEFKQHNQLIFARANNHIIQSSDNGNNWRTVVDKNRIVGGISLKERNIRRFHYESTHNKLYFSTSQKYISSGNEAGKLYVLDITTNKVTELTPLLKKAYAAQKKSNGIEAIQITPFQDNKLLFSVSHYNTREGIVYEYDIESEKIVEYNLPNRSSLGISLFWFAGFEFNKVNPLIRYIGDIYVYKSVDGGLNYKRLFGYSLGDNNVPHVDIREIQITKHSADGKSDHIYVGTDGGLSFSNNGGKTWRNLNGPELQLTQFYGIGSSPFSGVVSAGAQDNSIITYSPQEKKWTYNVRGDGYDVAYSKNKPGKAYGQYNARAMGATNNDVVPFSKGMQIGAVENSNNRKTLVTHKNGDLFFGTQSLYHRPNNSKKWKEYKTPLSHNALTLAVSASNPEVIYMSGLWGDLVKTTDGGQNWEKLNDYIVTENGKHSERIMSICVSPYDEDRVWIGLGYVGTYDDLCKNTVRILETNDGGKTWQNATKGLPVFAIQDIVFYEGSYESIFAATEQGVYFKRGTGYKWQRFGENLPNSLIGELNINYCRGKIMAATYGRGLWESDLPPIEKKNPEIIKRAKTLTAPAGEAIALNRNLKLRKRAQLIIDCPVYLPKGGKITVFRKNQVTFTNKGKIINGCDEKISGITLR